MAWAWIADAYGQATGNTVSTSTTLNLQAGDVLIAILTNDNTGTDQTPTIAVADSLGNNVFTTSLVRNENWGVVLGSAYLLAATANASATIRAAMNQGGTWHLVVRQFRLGVGETAVFQNAAINGVVWGNSVTAGPVSITGDSMVIGGAGPGGSRTYSSMTIGGVAVSESRTQYGVGYGHRFISIDTSPSFTANLSGDGTTLGVELAFRFTGSGPTPIEGIAQGIQARQAGNASGGILYQGQAGGTQARQTGQASGQITYQGTAQGQQSRQTGQAQCQIVYQGQASGTQSRQTGQAQCQIVYQGQASGTQSRQTGQAYGGGPVPIEGTASGTQAKQSGGATGAIAYLGTASGAQARQAGGASCQIMYIGTAQGTQSRQTGWSVAGYQGEVLRGTAYLTLGLSRAARITQGITQEARVSQGIQGQGRITERIQAEVKL